jgi:hypothetical protein
MLLYAQTQTCIGSIQAIRTKGAKLEQKTKCDNTVMNHKADAWLKPKSDPSVHLIFSLLVIDGVAFLGVDSTCMQWCSTECRGAEYGILVCSYCKQDD